MALAIDTYIAAFRRQAIAAARPEDQLLDEVGLIGLLRGGTQTLRLVVCDDRALHRLENLIRDLPSGVVTVLEDASSSSHRLATAGDWSVKPVQVMVSGDLSSTPARSLPDGLVRRRLGDPCAPDLLSAARLVVRADPTVSTIIEIPQL